MSVEQLRIKLRKLEQELKGKNDEYQSAIEEIDGYFDLCKQLLEKGKIAGNNILTGKYTGRDIEIINVCKEFNENIKNNNEVLFPQLTLCEN